MWNSPLVCLVAFSALLSAGASPAKSPAPPASPWWKNSIIYQVYPHSFKDSDGNGIGDIPGITSKLEYIREVADVVWLSPIYPSPQKDFGYDITNFVGVNPLYGTLKDFDELVAKAKSIGLRVVLDLVPNHTSDEHEWFKKSIKRIAPYDNYYIWNDGKLAENGTRLPPNNWLQTFTGSMWRWNEERGQFFLHQFIQSQPDLNYRNPLVQEEMKKVLRFWLDRGIDGFRVDAIAHLFEDTQLRDEPRSGMDVPSDFYDYYEHIYTRDLSEDYDVVRSWKQMFDDYARSHNTEKKVLLMEVGSKLHFVMKYYDVDTEPFNFGFVHNLRNDSRAKDFKKNIDDWLNSMPKGKTANWIVGNHDVHRVASRFGYEHNRADQMSMLSVVLPGITIIYNGDEIGMEDRFFTYKDTLDPAGCNAGPDKYTLKSRDPERTPFQWDDSVSAGFSTSPKTWRPVHENYKSLNLAAERKAEVSHFKVFQALVKLKKREVIARGSTKVLLYNKDVLAVVRRLTGYKPVVLFINFDYNSVTVNATRRIGIPHKMNIYAASVKSGLKSGQEVNTMRFVLPGASSVILGPSE